MASSKIQRGFYPISYTRINQLMKNCRGWDYGNKDTCNYVAYNILQDLDMNYPNLPIRDSLRSDLISITHDINNGRITKGKVLTISIND
jgi:hypothetical protein